MSMLPLLLNMAEDLSDLAPVDYDFGLGIYPQEIRRVQQRCPRLYMTYPRRKHCPYALEKKKSGGTGKVIKDKENYSVGKDGFQVCMDVQQFQPNELTVKTVENTVVIEGKHDERDDEHGSISRHFVRKYSLPAGYDPKEVVSTLSSDGILTVKAPPPPAKGLKNKKERMIQIQETGPAHLSVKENPKEGEQKKAEEAKDDKMED